MSLKTKKINWIDPLNLAQKIADNYRSESWILLYSGLHDEIKNSRSIIALFPQEELILNNLEQLKIISKSKWFGYLSYEAGDDLHITTQKSFIDLPILLLSAKLKFFALGTFFLIQLNSRGLGSKVI